MFCWCSICAPQIIHATHLKLQNCFRAYLYTPGSLHAEFFCGALLWFNWLVMLILHYSLPNLYYLDLRWRASASRSWCSHLAIALAAIYKILVVYSLFSGTPLASCITDLKILGGNISYIVVLYLSILDEHNDQNNYLLQRKIRESPSC